MTPTHGRSAYHSAAFVWPFFGPHGLAHLARTITPTPEWVAVVPKAMGHPSWIPPLATVRPMGAGEDVIFSGEHLHWERSAWTQHSGSSWRAGR